MRVLIVSIVHTPLDARIHHRQIRALRDADVAVTQVGPWSTIDLDPAAVVPGVVTVDVPRAVGRRRLRALRHARRVIARLGPEHDVVLLHDPELVLAVAGRLRRLPPVVLDVHEDLPASLEDRSWFPRPLRRAIAAATRRLERWAEHHLAGLLLAEDGYRSRFGGDHPVVPNLPWLPPEEPSPTDPRRVVYLGRVSTGRGAHELIAIGERLTAADGPRLEVTGAADDDVRPLVERAHRRGVLRWHGFLPNDVALAGVEGALVGLALLHDLPNYRGSLPTKVAEYLAHGVPAIVTPLPQAVRMVETSGAGVVVGFGDVDGAVDAILGLAADAERRARWGRQGRAYIEGGHSWDAIAPVFVGHLRRLAAAPAGGER